MTFLNDIQFIWFSIFVALLVGYAILDGFDLGVGMLHLFSKDDRERRIMLNTIGPVWDGNEVWLVTAGGAVFAGFPVVYAALCTAFYTPVMLLLSSLIFRAIAIEFRSKQPHAWWRWTWDVLFSLASLQIAFILGVIMGNLILGIKLDENHDYIGDFSDLIHPYAILVGVMTSLLFFMHGAIYTLMKTEGELHDKMRKWVNPAIIAFVIAYVTATMATLIYMPHMTKTLQERPVFFVLALINILAIANIPREIHFGRDAHAFASSCANILCLLGLYAIGTYPNVVRAVNDPENLSLTIYNSSATETTLGILLIISLIGVPLVAAYTFTVYWVFRGKVQLDSTSY